jgi:hypothetical protein
MSRILQPPSLEYKSLKFGNKDPKVVACNEKMFPCETIGAMVQVMEIRFLEFEKPLFSGQ